MTRGSPRSVPRCSGVAWRTEGFDVMFTALARFVLLGSSFLGLADPFVGRINGARCRFFVDRTGRDVGHHRI
ncbi:hypothetical protein A3216_07790 [Mycobacterium leprae 7935681]|nr:hypothetical protein A3216_07790 [Mycobacterium leprae 7935681]